MFVVGDRRISNKKATRACEARKDCPSVIRGVLQRIAPLRLRVQHNCLFLRPLSASHRRIRYPHKPSHRRHGDLHLERAPSPHPCFLPRNPMPPSPSCNKPPLVVLPSQPSPLRAPAPATRLHLRAGAGPRGRLRAALPRRRRGGSRCRRRDLILRRRHLGRRLGAALAPQGPHRGLPRRARRLHRLHPLHAALLR